MKIVTIFASLVSIFLLAPFMTYAADIDNIINYKSPPTPLSAEIVQPYSIQDIIAKLPESIDDNGIYIQNYDRILGENWINDPRFVAFDEGNFGKCEEYYIRMENNYGGIIFRSTLKYLFPKNEEMKARASEDLQSAMTYIKHPGNLNYGNGKCDNRNKYHIKLTELLNALIEAAPMILQEKQHMVAMVQAANILKQDQENERARIKQQSEAKAEAEREAMELAEMRENEERTNKLETCRNKITYRLYEISTIIEHNRRMANDALQEIHRQKEGEKISGYVDKQVMYRMRNIIVGANNLNKDNFKMYKRLGGSARQVESVKSLSDPCKM